MINLKYVLHPSSCGYFCLKYIVKDIKVKCSGYMSLYEMKEHLHKSGYYCVGVRVRSIDSVRGKCITFISYKNSLHYVVVNKINDKFIYIYDPLFLFEIKVKKEKFLMKWGKVCLFYSKI